MQLIPFHSSDSILGNRITQFQSHGAFGQHLLRGYRDASVACITLEPGGLLGRHQAVGDQLFLVISGNGIASGGDGQFQPIQSGTAALWRSGEEHETRAGPGGLVALVIEGTLAGG